MGMLNLLPNSTERAMSTPAPLRGQFEHLVERHLVQFARVGHDPRICREYTVDVGVDLAHLRAVRGGQRDSCCIGPASSECRHFLGIRRHSLKSRHDDDLVLSQALGDTVAPNACDPRFAVCIVCEDAGLRAGEADRLDAFGVECHRQ